MPWAWGSPASSLKPPMPVRWPHPGNCAHHPLPESDSRDLEIIPVEDLKEVDGGSYEPMSYAELMTDEGMQFSGVTTEEFTNQFHEKDPEGLAES